MENKNKNFTLLILGFMTFLANGDNFATATLISNMRPLQNKVSNKLYS